MILLTAAKCLIGGSVQFELPKRNMVIDPRPNQQRVPIRNENNILLYYHRFGRFKCVYHNNGMKVTLTRVGIEAFEDDETHLVLNIVTRGANKKYFKGPFEFRVYDPEIETVPSFISNTYTYLGIDGEKAPADTTTLIIDQSVKNIQEEAFACCWNLKKCIMNDGVETIGMWAFLDCSAMKMIKLSRSLKHIEAQAFESCSSLEAIFLPPSIEKIEAAAFADCTSIRILRLHSNIEMAETTLIDCDTLFETTQIEGYIFELTIGQLVNADGVLQSVIDFYNNLPLLHQTCLGTGIHAQAIDDCVDAHGPDTVSRRDHDGMTPLHILAMNPHAEIGVIGACFRLNLNAAFMKDNRGNTPLDYLTVHHDIEHHTFLMASLCMHREDG